MRGPLYFQLKNFVKGDAFEAEADIGANLSEFCDVDAIAKIHKVPQEKKNDKKFLADLLVSRVATKDLA